MAIIPIQSFEQALLLMHQANGADGFEFRLDYLPHIRLEEIKQLQQAAKKTVLFTVRKSDQGGVYKGDENARLEVIEKLMTLKPDYFDIEHEVPIEFCRKIKAISPHTQLICSNHNFINTPDNLPQLLQNMINPVYSAYKIITTAKSILDTLNILHFVKQYSSQYPLVAHAMGEVGVTSRILGKILGNHFTYASVNNEKDVAPGLLSVDELVNIYHYSQLNTQTQLYGLIGDPVTQSIGHQFHNAEFIKHKQNAVYVKFHVKPEELDQFFLAINDLPVQGLSVTMPHKQAVLKYCQHLTTEAQAIGAVNTLIKRTNGYWGANTDGDAVLQILSASPLCHPALVAGSGKNSNIHQTPQQVRGDTVGMRSDTVENQADNLIEEKKLFRKKVILLGAGGAANSIIYSLINAGAQVSVYNRTHEKLMELSKKYPIQIITEKDLPNIDYDILINTIPAKFYQNNIHLVKNKIVLDANYQATPTPLIQDALKHDCICIDGYAMFYAQAQMQRQLWFHHDE